MACHHSLLSVIDTSSHTLPIRTFRLPSRPPHAFPPRRLSLRFPRRFLADYPSPRLPAVRADFITFVPRSFRLLGTSIAPPKRCRPSQTGSRQPISQHIRIAFGRRIVLRNHIASRHPFRIAVQLLHRLDRLVAWLRDWRGGRA